MDNITVSTGIVFKAKAVPLNAFDIVRRKCNEVKPKVPVKYMPEKDRDEQNPNDPEYLDALSEWDSNYAEAILDMVFAVGITVVSIPDGMYNADDKEWAETFVALGFDIPDGGQGRFLKWMKLYAAVTVDDMIQLQGACSRMTGVPEKDVADAAAAFRSQKGEPTD